MIADSTNLMKISTVAVELATASLQRIYQRILPLDYTYQDSPLLARWICVANSKNGGRNESDV
jgi:hypothetical protein